MIMTIINTIAFVVMILVNILANTGRLGGYTTGEISSQYNNLLTPAGWTFSIWGVIYALLLVFVVASFFNNSARDITNRIGNWFWISCVFNILWLLTWHSNLIWLSMIMMVGLLATLIGMNIKLIGTYNLFSAGFSTYLGWITVAFLANFTVMLVSFGMNGLGTNSQIWTTAILPVAALIIAAVVFFKADWVYGLTAMVAYLGIVYRQIAPTGLNAKYAGPLTASLVSLVMITFVTIFLILNGRMLSKFAFFRN